MKTLAALIAAILISTPAYAVTTYKIFDLHDGGSLQAGDGFEVSRGGNGSYHVTGTELFNSVFSNAPGAPGQIAFNSGGSLTTADAPTVRGLLGLAPVASTGAYGSLTGLPAIPSAQVNSDWNASSGLAQILNKPTTIGGYGIADTTAQPLTGFTASTGTVTSADTILTAIEKLSGTPGGVSTIFGRAGTVTAQSGDYTVSQVTGAAPSSSPTLNNATLSGTITASALNATGVVTNSSAGLLSSSPALPLSLGGTGAVSSGNALANLNGARTWPTGRPPSINDDTTKGYIVGDLWNHDGHIWSNMSVTAGAAMWQELPLVSTYPIDTVTGAAAAYATYKLRSAYSGNAFVITRASDSSTQTIGFTTNGSADWGAVDRFCLNTTCGVSTLYDQSGNGYDLTQSTQANMPQVSYGDMINGSRSITFDGSSQQSTLRYMSNSALPISNRQNLTAFMVERNLIGTNSGVQTATAAGAAFFDIGNPTAKFTFYNDSLVNGLAINAGSVVDLGVAARGTPQVTMLRNTSSSVLVQQNNKLTSFSTSLTSSAATGILLGNTTLTTGYQGNFEFGALIVYNSTLASSSDNLLFAGLYTIWGIKPQVQDNVIVDGDSITHGYNSTSHMWALSSYAGRLPALLSRPVNFTNLGYSGNTAYNAVNIGEGTAWGALAYEPGGLNVVLLFLGTNDMAQLASPYNQATNAYASLQSLCAQYKAVHSDWRCVVGTPLPRDSNFANGNTQSSFETQRQALAAMIRTSSWADGYVDFAADPVMGVYSASTNTTLYPDATHPSSDVGYSYLAQDAAAGLATILQQ